MQPIYRIFYCPNAIVSWYFLGLELSGITKIDEFDYVFDGIINNVL